MGRSVSGGVVSGGGGDLVQREAWALGAGANGSADLDADGSDVLTIAPSAVDAFEAAVGVATTVVLTTVVFTTSPLLLDRAHRVAFIEGGRLVAVDMHRDLLATEPRYAAVVTRGEDEG